MKRRTLLLSASLPLFIGANWTMAQNQHYDADVIVVGSGAAGLSAALTAAEGGSSVLILEKMPTIGGNTLLSTGLINAPDPQKQKPLGIEDSNDLFFKHTYEAGHRQGNTKLISVLVENALPTIRWLETYGIYFKDEMIQIYGGLYPRGHNPKVSHGRGYVTYLSKACKDKNIPIKTNSQVVEILTEEQDGKKRVIGVNVSTNQQIQNYYARKGVIIATGGFTANQALCSKFDPRLKNMAYTGSPAATGEILEQLKTVGAQLSDLKEIQCNLGPIEGYSSRSGFHTDVKRHILVNKHGNRFINEDGLRDTLRDAVLSQPDSAVFIIVDSEGFQNLSSKFQQNGATSQAQGFGWKADSIEKLAEAMKMPPENLKATVDSYNKAVETKKDPFGREPWMLVKKIEKAPFYASQARMSIHYTMGGVVIDEKARVLDASETPITGLYAAGEVTTGVHGTNRVGGNGILDAFVFGRIAGTSASQN